MSTIKNSITIPKDVSTGNDLDYQFLKQKGIEYIESMGGGLWTDYNEHDPGVTMLEVLAYAITDLGNRINLPIQDLLTSENGTGINGQFYKPSEILVSDPVTASDYRKLFIDIEGVRNCWIMPYEKVVYVNCKDSKLSYDPAEFSSLPAELRSEFTLKGLNKILVDYDLPEDLTPVMRSVMINKINKLIRAKYHAHRNLCEDLVEISEVGSQQICICSEIEVENTADEDDVHARVLFAIRQYFSPGVTFYSLKQMIDKGYRTEQIFEGPFLEHGYIDTPELLKSGLRKEVRLSDLMKIVSEVKGVKLIKDITICDCDSGEKQNEWLICIDPGKRPVMCDDSTFSYRKDVMPVLYNQARVDAIYASLVAEEDAYNAKAAFDRELSFPQGEYHETGFYTTIQNDLPDTYGIGPAGLPSTASIARKAQAKQLKAYLLFFDQVLASYFAHLSKVKDQLSVNGNLSDTYFTQAVKDIEGLSDLVTDYPVNNDAELSGNLMGPFDDTVKRRNELLDHLLARFAEQFSEYAFVMKELYGSLAPSMVLHAKEVFLKEYVELSSARGTAFNWYKQPNGNLWNTSNVSGAEKRIARLAGVKDYNRRNLATTNVVDIYLPVGATAYKWRIRNASGHVVLSSVRDYATMDLAAEEVYAAVRLMLETTQAEVEAAFESPVVDGQLIGNLEVLESGGGHFYFQVLDLHLDPSDPLRILGRQLVYNDTLWELKESMLATIEYLAYDMTEEGIFLVENILLRPDVTWTKAPEAQFLEICDDACGSCCSADPYSFKVTVVMPGFLPRFADPDYRLYMEKLIQEELPAHVLARICWVGSRKDSVPDAENELLIFQTAFRNYLYAKTSKNQEQDEPTLLALNDILINLNTIYPQGRLYSCESEEIEGRIVLGRTKIGTLNNENYD